MTPAHQIILGLASPLRLRPSEANGFAEQQDGAPPGVEFCVEDEQAVDGARGPVGCLGAGAFQREAVVFDAAQCGGQVGYQLLRPDDPEGLNAVMSERRRLINLSYRLLGSLAEAEDAVQETYARWYALPRQQQQAIENPGAWLTTVASRICLNLLGSARIRRERYVGEWIPEPLPERTQMTFLERAVNGQPGLVAQQDGVTVTVFAFDVADDRIRHIWVVRNPEKLRPWTSG
jgi:Sigma-70 region 2